MKIKFLGAAGTVTGSCYLLDTGKVKIMVDCGLFQGNKEIRERNYRDFQINPEEVDFILLTHAHVDHSGLIPKFCKEGFKGRIITSTATKDLCAIMLPDSAHIQEMEVERKNRKLARAGLPLIEPIYTVDDANECLGFFEGVHYNEEIKLAQGIKVYFRDAGHILGSAIIEVVLIKGHKETKIVFSGDLGNSCQPIINDPTIIEEADYLFIESTYGSRLHQNCENKIEILRQIILETWRKRGKVIIPSFAVERTQDLLYDLNILYNQKQIPEVPVYIDSPLAIEATEIFRRNIDYFDDDTKELIAKGHNPLEIPNLTITKKAQDSKALNDIIGSIIIISASGMCEAGRIRHHLKHNLWRPESTILFVGYQAEGTLGRRLIEGEKLVHIYGEEVAVKARIAVIDGFSAHADQAGLMNWLGSFKKKPQKVFVVHGEGDASKTLAEKIKDELNIEAVIPQYLEEIEINTGKIFNKEFNNSGSGRYKINEATPIGLKRKLRNMQIINGELYRLVQPLTTIDNADVSDINLYQQIIDEIELIEEHTNKLVNLVNQTNENKS